MPASPLELAAALLLTLLGAVVQGSIGFGLAVVAAPLLLLLDPALVPGPLLFSALLLTILIAYRERKDVIGRDIAMATVGRVLGTAAAAYAISVLPASTYDLVFSLMVLTGVVISLGGWHITPTPRNVIAAGALSGLTGTISSVGGPPLALVYQMERGARIRATLSAIFTIGTLISLVGLWSVGKFGWTEMKLGAVLMPGVVVGFYLSRYTARYIDRVHARPWVLGVSALSAMMVLVRAVMSMIDATQ